MVAKAVKGHNRQKTCSTWQELNIYLLFILLHSQSQSVANIWGHPQAYI